MLSKKNRRQRRIVAFLLAVLGLGGCLSFPAADVFADTIGDVLDNTTSTVPKDPLTGNQWNMYQIEGIPGNRDRRPNEGSFVKSGYASSGTPIASTNGMTGTSDNAQANDWNNGRIESPTLVTFPDKPDSSHGTPWFSFNYVNKNDFVDFKDYTNANAFNSDAGQAYYNPKNVQSKMGADNQLKPGQSFKNGFCKLLVTYQSKQLFRNRRPRLTRLWRVTGALWCRYGYLRVSMRNL